ncbi:hypothetical protein HELRODRAFT_173278 [Helobdella robusta]|uniref:Uncharacterized protein n=1 Tax=Helobdella robusta TaxID=6412 RepID=T1F6M6_HELRO|nr:hypothetical protein HELRODRAFT_173278 [Helobdella robusta]ESO03575.1 hypothetical protein HELRODRAFT_173278 [Helobdella robusta]
MSIITSTRPAHSSKVTLIFIWVSVTSIHNNISGGESLILCYQCESCFIPTNYDVCPVGKGKCLFEHTVYEDNRRETVRRGCVSETFLNHCDEMLEDGMKTFTCRDFKSTVSGDIHFVTPPHIAENTNLLNFSIISDVPSNTEVTVLKSSTATTSTTTTTTTTNNNNNKKPESNVTNLIWRVFKYDKSTKGTSQQQQQ